MSELVIEIRSVAGLPEVRGQITSVARYMTASLGNSVALVHGPITAELPEDLACFALKRMGQFVFEVEL